MRLAIVFATLIGLAACGHSDAFVNMVPPVDPPATSTDMRLTYNSDQDYWPTWTEDGQGILYSFVDPGSQVLHRCVGLLPAGGGPRRWQLCDNRATQGDSINSIAAYALNASGQLLYVESASNIREISALPSVTLWLADTATPFVRTRLLTLPQSEGGVAYTWLADLHWTGATTFIGLAQLFEVVGHCVPSDPVFCPQRDTIFFNVGAVMRGTLDAGQASFATVAGTDGATSYSLAEGGNSIVYTRLHDLRVWKVPAAGGTPVTVATIAQGSVAELLGVSCQATTCVVASAPVKTAHPEIPTSPRLLTGTAKLESVSLTTGASQLLLSNGSAITQSTIYSSPQLSPTGGNVVMQVGGTWWGHIQTFYGGGNADLHLYPAVVH